MQDKYSEIMNVVYLTMIFGPAMPILFPICFGTLMTMYSVEIFMLHYVFKQPPSYDEKLNNRVLKNLAFAPCLMLAMSFWMFSSPELLGTYDSMEPLKFKKDPFNAKHYWMNSLNLTATLSQGPAGILLIFTIAYLVYLLASKWVKACMKREYCGCSLSKFMDKDIAMNEDIDPFYMVLDNDDRNYTLSEEINCKLYTMTTMLDSANK